MQRAVLEELGREYKDRLNIVFIDVYERRDLAAKLKITAVPAQVFFDSSGNPVLGHLGPQSRDNLVAQLKSMGIE